ncbi:MAG: TraR/DksA C4-type zinc finger protein [Phycisphaerae bacterium]|nr:TraR/DksA C4-type zinc finger protein [Phycisphaerae bacterium]
MTPEEIQSYRRLLLEKWAELVGDVNYMENEALRKSRLDAAGDLSSMPIHMADLGTDNFEQEFSLGLMDSERKILLEIVAALRRMNDGTFGICEGTGKPISKARLNANPWARYCIDYARMVEKGVVTEGEKVYRKDDTSFDDESDEIDEDFEDEDIFDDAEEEDVEFETDVDEDEDEEIEL